MIELKNKYLSIGIIPELGAGLAFMQADIGGVKVDLMRQAPEIITHPNQLACYLLMPWSNRIGQGGITVEGVFYPLPPNVEDPYPLHGDGWLSTWDILSQSTTQASFGLDSSDLAPFNYTATVDYALIENQLEIRMAITHLGDKALPYGMGIHPFFTRTPETILLANMSEIYPEDAQTLPHKAESVDLHPDWDFRASASPKKLPAVFTNHQFQKWDGSARITWPELKCGLQIENSAKWEYAVIYAPENEDFFCFEPVSHVVDAHHHQAPSSEGLIWLSNGQTLANKLIFKLL